MKTGSFNKSDDIINKFHNIFLKCSAPRAVGIGVIIRDDEGRVEAALSKKIYALLAVVEVEAKAFETSLICQGHWQGWP